MLKVSSINFNNNTAKINLAKNQVLQTEHNNSDKYTKLPCGLTAMALMSSHVSFAKTVNNERVVKVYENIFGKGSSVDKNLEGRTDKNGHFYQIIAKEKATDKLESKITRLKDNSFVVVTYRNGIRKTIGRFTYASEPMKVLVMQPDGKKLKKLADYDKELLKQERITCFAQDGKTKESISIYNPETGNLLEEVIYEPNGIVPSGYIYYDIFDGTKYAASAFKKGGRVLDYKIEYNPQTSQESKITYFADDGRTISAIVDFDAITGNQSMHTFFAEDGKTVKAIIEYNPNSNRAVRKIFFKPDGSISSVLQLKQP